MHLVLKGMWVQGTGEDSKRKSINKMGTGTKTSLNSDFSVFLGKCCFHSKENSKKRGTKGEIAWCCSGNDWKIKVKVQEKGK